MKHLFHASEKHKAMSFTLLRIIVGIIFIVHGTAKWAMWGVTPSEQMPEMMLWIMRILSIVEPIAGLAMVLGLFVPIAGAVFVVIMVGAIFFKITQFGSPFVFPTGAAGWSYDLLIFGAAIVLKKNGGGWMSLDDMMAKKKLAMSATKPQSTN